MLYPLFNYLNALFGISLFTYISFRAIVAGVLSLCLSVWLGKFFIKWMRNRKIYETQRDEKLDPDANSKKEVVTMGGLFVIFAMLASSLLMGRLTNVYMVLMIVTTVSMGVLGFADDYIKTFRKNKDGLKPRYKIMGQLALGVIVALTLYAHPAVTMNETVSSRIENNVVVVEKSPEVKSTRTTIPFVKRHNFNYADLFSWMGEKYMYYAGWIFFLLLTVFVVAALSNGANLNDGMDGMCAGNSVIIAIGLLLLAYMSGSVLWAEYFDVMYIPGSEELVVFLATFVGALLGFLWWNGFPAEVYLGDTGSLTIGGIIGVCAMSIHKELMLPLLCGIFLMESVSVIIQTRVYKFYKKRGKHVRIWRKTPFHDHFCTTVEEMHKNDPTCSCFFSDDSRVVVNKMFPGIAKPKIVLRFCIITLILAALTFLTLKIR